MEFDLAWIEEDLKDRFTFLQSLLPSERQWSDFAELHQLFIQVKQAQALESIAQDLASFRIHGLPVENAHL